jgi:hypothetical protein
MSAGPGSGYIDHPFEVEVWEEEYSTGRDLWASKPRTQIQKVAEAQALRRGVSISGLYEPSEIDEGDVQRVSTGMRVMRVDEATGEIKQSGPADVVEGSAREVPNGGRRLNSKPSPQSASAVRGGERAAQIQRMYDALAPLGIDEDYARELFLINNPGRKAVKDLPVADVTAIVDKVIATYTTYELAMAALEADEEPEADEEEAEEI